MNIESMRAVIVCLLILTLRPISLQAFTHQQSTGSLSGKVIDTHNEAVYPVAIYVEGTTIGEYTDIDGNYTLKNVPAGNQTLVVSGIGVKTVRQKIQVVAGKETRVPDIITDAAVELNEIVVEGKTEARRQQEQAYAISVLDVKKTYNTTAPLNKIMNKVSSVRIREDGGVGSNYNFSLNGFSGNQVKFFLDGIPMDNFGSSFNLSNISVNMAERIEVYKGVLPVGLGGDALGGAVNIISRKDANFLDASYSVGSFNTHRVSLNEAYTNPATGFTVRANAFYNYSDNDYKVYVPIVNLETNKKTDER